MFPVVRLSVLDAFRFKRAQLNIPAPVGMICVGLFLRNVSGAILITGLKKSWSKEIRGAALAMIFLRSGLELDLRVCCPFLLLPTRCFLWYQS